MTGPSSASICPGAGCSEPPVGYGSLRQDPGPIVRECGVMVSYQRVPALLQGQGEGEVSQQVMVMCVGSGKQSISRTHTGNSKAETDAPEVEGGYLQCL